MVILPVFSSTFLPEPFTSIRHPSRKTSWRTCPTELSTWSNPLHLWGPTLWGWRVTSIDQASGWDVCFFCLIKNHQNIVKMRSCWFKAPKMWRSTVNLNRCLGLYFSNWDTPPDDEGLYVWTQPLNPNMALQELATNYIWLKPIAQHFPTEVPGAVVLTDVFLHHGKNLDQSYI